MTQLDQMLDQPRRFFCMTLLCDKRYGQQIVTRDRAFSDYKPQYGPKLLLKVLVLWSPSLTLGDNCTIVRSGAGLEYCAQANLACLGKSMLSGRPSKEL